MYDVTLMRACALHVCVGVGGVVADISRVDAYKAVNMILYRFNIRVLSAARDGRHHHTHTAHIRT